MEIEWILGASNVSSMMVFMVHFLFTLLFLARIWNAHDWETKLALSTMKWRKVFQTVSYIQQWADNIQGLEILLIDKYQESQSSVRTQNHLEKI